MLVSHRADTQEVDVENLATIWHPSRDFLAVSTYKSNDGGDVGFFTKQVYISILKIGTYLLSKPILLGRKIIFQIEEKSRRSSHHHSVAQSGARLDHRMG